MDELWKCERRLWLEAASAYAELLRPHALMTFPAPAGIMKADSIVDSLREAPPWTQVEMADRACSGDVDGQRP